MPLMSFCHIDYYLGLSVSVLMGSFAYERGRFVIGSELNKLLQFFQAGNNLQVKQLQVRQIYQQGITIIYCRWSQQYNRQISILKMNFNQQLYKEFVQRKRSKPTNNQPIYLQKRREILHLFMAIPDEELINLESSIIVLKKLSIIRTIEGVEHIVNIMERKKKCVNSWSGSEEQLLECRLIYFLWAVIEEQCIQMREFKEIILLLSQDYSKNKAELIRELYGEKEGIEQLVDCWQRLAFGQNHTRSQQQISDISIIKSKNEGHYDSNKQNISYFQEEDSASSNRIIAKSNITTNYTNTLQKSFQKREDKSRLSRSKSGTKMTAGRKSLSSSSTSAVGSSHFYTTNQNLTPLEEKGLITRLYNCDKYKQREELKKKIEKQRLQAQLNQCSFKPNLEDRSRAMSKSKLTAKEVKGYDKAIDRMKNGYKKNKELKENLQYRIWRQPSINQKNHRESAPKFLSRVKQAAVELFQIVFTIGRHNIRIKIKQSDRIGDIVSNIGQIYCLKEQNKEYIRSIIEDELNRYYETKCTDQQQ